MTVSIMDNYYGESMTENLGTAYVQMDDRIEVSNDFNYLVYHVLT